MTPLLNHICNKHNLPAIPYLLAIGTSAKIDSIATLTGNPQNMLITSFSAVNYLYFALHNMLIVLISLLLDYMLIQYLYLHNLVTEIRQQIIAPPLFKSKHPLLLAKSIIVTVGVIILFFTGLRLEIITLGGTNILLLDKITPQRIYQLTEWLIFNSIY